MEETLRITGKTLMRDSLQAGRNSNMQTEEKEAIGQEKRKAEEN